jgi:hypothetical protein
VDKENVPYVYNELFNHKREQNHDICRKWMELEITVISNITCFLERQIVTYFLSYAESRLKLKDLKVEGELFGKRKRKRTSRRWTGTKEDSCVWEVNITKHIIYFMKMSQ